MSLRVLQGVGMKKCSDRWLEAREEECASDHDSVEATDCAVEDVRRAHSDLCLVMVRSHDRAIWIEHLVSSLMRSSRCGAVWTSGSGAASASKAYLGL